MARKSAFPDLPRFTQIYRDFPLRIVLGYRRIFVTRKPQASDGGNDGERNVRRLRWELPETRL